MSSNVARGILDLLHEASKADSLGKPPQILELEIKSISQNSADISDVLGSEETEFKAKYQVLLIVATDRRFAGIRRASTGK